jgi:hypothetical protein
MKLSFRCDTTYFRSCMRRRAQAPTVGQVWKAMGFAAMSVGLLCVAVATSSLSLACFCVALMGVAFSMVLPAGVAE